MKFCRLTCGQYTGVLSSCIMAKRKVHGRLSCRATQYENIITANVFRFDNVTLTTYIFIQTIYRKKLKKELKFGSL